MSKLAHDLAHYTGTEKYHYNPIFKAIKYTDGVQFLGREHGWAVTDILAILLFCGPVQREDFVSVTIKPEENNIVYDDGNGRILFEQEYFGGMDIDCEIKMFCTNGVLMLSSEY